jgi:hypothetical protein
LKLYGEYRYSSTFSFSDTWPYLGLWSMKEILFTSTHFILVCWSSQIWHSASASDLALDISHGNGISRQFERRISRTVMSQGTPAAPALPFEILLPRLAEFCIARDLCQIFRKDATFQQFQFGCQQIFYVPDIAGREHNIAVSINGLVRAFDCPRSSVQWALAHRLEPPREWGKQTALDADREQQIRDWTQQKAKQITPVGKTEIKNYCTPW